ncbi:MAG: methylated-DNA--[protein]-cysteine S-methyltransferase [Candidatus Bipolaricaulota bacterium]|nr:methylated-DNA--[protein]-cysteine S-methyltransferase [Candidatus Bipolaricaulota bacterium]
MREEYLSAAILEWEDWQFILLSSQVGIYRIDLQGGSLAELSHRLKMKVVPDESRNNRLRGELERYLAGRGHSFSCSLDLQGTPFQRGVWDALLEIPYGETCTYAEIAARIGRPKALRAVGQAIGANPTPIIIPCHRVIGKDGHLTGYGGGLKLKRRLLTLEGIPTPDGDGTLTRGYPAPRAPTR